METRNEDDPGCGVGVDNGGNRDFLFTYEVPKMKINELTIEFFEARGDPAIGYRRKVAEMPVSEFQDMNGKDRQKFIEAQEMTYRSVKISFGDGYSWAIMPPACLQLFL